MSYTEEVGEAVFGNHKDGFKNDQYVNFTINGNYTGAGLPSYLFYDGHKGVDYRSKSGTKIYATADGVFTIDAQADGDSKTLSQAHINHNNGYKTIYMHCRKFFVASGKNVKAGQLIGEVGDEGSPGEPHLHLQIMYQGIPVDPYGWLANQDDNNHSWTRAINSTLWAKNNGGYVGFVAVDTDENDGVGGGDVVTEDVVMVEDVKDMNIPVAETVENTTTDTNEVVSDVDEIETTEETIEDDELIDDSANASDDHQSDEHPVKKKKKKHRNLFGCGYIKTNNSSGGGRGGPLDMMLLFLMMTLLFFKQAKKRVAYARVNLPAKH